MLKLKNIDKTFYKGSVNEKVLFTDFNLHVKKGEFVSVVGSNGSGKTTLLNIISGNITPDGGEVFVDGEDFTKLKDYKRARKIARVFQNPAVGTCPSMTIFENMSIADNKLKPFNLTRGLNHKRKDFYKSQLEVLGLGLEDRLDTPTGNLSGGQRQALALIMATMVKPDLLLLDEHTAALDPKSSDVVMELTQKIIDEKDVTTLMVTHNLRYAINYGSRILMMHGGNVILDKTGEERDGETTDGLLKVFNEISIECGN